MKSIKLAVLIAGAAGLLTGCAWIQEPQPGKQQVKDFFISPSACEMNVNADYAPLQWELDETYFSEWFIGDICSDDAVKGGQGISDMAMAYDLENFRGNADNTILLSYYRANLLGIARCNSSLEWLSDMEFPDDSTWTDAYKNRLLGEVYFLRAYYMFRLLRVFGAFPMSTEPIKETTKWRMARTDVPTIYAQIESDLLQANSKLMLKSQMAPADAGRATKGAAQAMLLKTFLYRGEYAQAKAWGDSVISSGEYDLVADYAVNFKLEGENNIESVFEIQYVNEDASDYGGRGCTRGNFTTILTRSRAQSGGEEGWGFNKPSQSLYDEFEDGDARRDATILLPPSQWQKDDDNYLGNHYLNRKTGLYNEAGDGSAYHLAHHTRGDLNNKQIRYADVLLMYAEACAESGDATTAATYLNMVRARARDFAISKGADPSVLPDYPGYTYKENGFGTAAAPANIMAAIRHERRVELGMEAHRWFDLVRWGIADQVMNNYRANEKEEITEHMYPFVKGVHELFPLPTKEIELNPMEQNPGY